MSKFRIVESEGHFQAQHIYIRKRLFRKNIIEWWPLIENEKWFYDTYDEALERIKHYLKIDEKESKSIITYIDKDGEEKM